ncbi:MAG: methyl-accepting chemotaxis protein [Candidatus Desantisbacteria bacterium]
MKSAIRSKIMLTVSLIMLFGTVINTIFTLVSIKITPERLQSLLVITAIETPIIIGIALLLIRRWLGPIMEFLDEIEDDVNKAGIEVAKKARWVALHMPVRIVMLQFVATLIIGASAGAWMRMRYGHLSGWESVAILLSTFVNSVNAAVLQFYLIIRFLEPVLRFTTLAGAASETKKGVEGISFAIKTQIAVQSLMLMSLFLGSVMFINFTSSVLEGRLKSQAEQMMVDGTKRIELLQKIGLATPNELSNVVADMRFGEKGYSFILDPKGTIIVSSSIQPISSEIIGKMVQIKGKGSYEDVAKGIMTIYAPLDELGWILATTYHASDFSQPINQMWGWLLCFTLIIVIAGFFYTYFITRDISIPINRLIDGSRRIADGDLTHVVTVVTGDEVGVMANIFNKMMNNVRNLMDSTHKISEERAKEQDHLQTSISNLLEVVNATSNGDLTKTSSVNSDDEIGQLSRACNKMITDLRELIGQIKAAALQISSSSSEILATSQQQATGSTEQATSVAEVTVTVEELANTSKQIAENADSVVKMAEDTLRNAQMGQDCVGNVIVSMEDIRDKTQASAKRILSLGEKSQKIGNVLEMINNIAAETKLIAFNAAIEAARAGEAGKGFAVVAVEVKKLAENVVDSTKTIKEIISEIQSLTNASVMAIEEEVKRVERGGQLAKTAGDSLSEILDMVDHTTKSSKQISIATQQQQTASEQVVSTMREIADVSKQSAAGSRQSITASSEMSILSQKLSNAVGRFVVEGK